jgi:antagonist of KipI
MTEEAFRVLEPGLLTTIQDLGRPHVVASGVPAGGAMDRFAHAAANLLVGNDRAAATLECTVRGPRLRAAHQCVVAVTGADLEPHVNGRPAPAWTAFAMQDGDELGFGRRRAGTRSYIAVAGGFLGDRWLGSTSTNLMTARGGMHGRALVAGDVLAAGDSMVPYETGRTLDESLRPRYDNHTLHAIAGPQAARLTPDSRSALFGARFTLSPNSNRMGYRLDGPTLEGAGDQLLSFALVAGAVQLPGGGKPILLMADHQTAGGYPVVAVVVSASMPIAAQLAPGDEMVFAETSVDSALEMRAGQLAALDSLMS